MFSHSIDIRVKARLMLLDELQLEGPVAIPRRFNRHRPESSL